MYKSVCYNCPNRHPPNCHSTCDLYLAECKALRERRDSEHKQRVYNRETEEILMRKKR